MTESLSIRWLSLIFRQVRVRWPAARLEPLPSGNLTILVQDDLHEWFAIGLVEITTGDLFMFPKPLAR